MKYTYTLILVVLFSIFCKAQTPIPSQEQDTLGILKLAFYDTKVMLKGIGHAYTGPLRWKKDDFIVAGAIVGGTALLYFVDDDVENYFIDRREDIPTVLDEAGERLGSPQVAYGITAGTYLFGLFTKNEKVRRTGALMTSSAVTAGLLQTLLKASTGRSRPTNGQGKFSFNPYSGEAGFRAFPSGHTILSVTMAHAVAKQFDNVWVKVGIYAIGSIAPLQRLWGGAHWLTDVALSAALSIVIVDSIDNYMNKANVYPDGSKKNNSISWKFNVGLGRAGLTGTF